MSYLLDTNACIALMQPGPSLIRARARALAIQATTDDLYTSSIVTFELWFGVFKGRYTEANRLRLLDFLAGQNAVLDFSAGDSEYAGKVRADLQAASQPIGPFDTLIAGQALARSMILITANVREFSRVQGLHWQGWTKAGG